MRKIGTSYTYSLVLLKELVRTDFKLRYQGSALGYVWSLLRPLFMFVILYLVFIRFLKIGSGVPHAPVYLLVGIVLWNYFSEVTTGSVMAIVGKGDLLRKLNFPKYVILLAVLFGATINLLLNAVVIAIFMYVNHVQLMATSLLVIPLLFELAVLSLGMGLLLSAIFVRLRDVSYIWDVIIQAGFYVTPIFYLLNSTQVPAEISRLLILNPMAQIIQDLRYSLITHETVTIASLYPNRYVWVVPIGMCVLVLVLGGLYFKSQAKSFAENV